MVNLLMIYYLILLKEKIRIEKIKKEIEEKKLIIKSEEKIKMIMVVKMENIMIIIDINLNLFYLLFF